MAVSFLRLWKLMEEQEAGAGETPAMQAIRTGINQSPDFWDQFMMVLNNADHVADLLGVTSEQVGSWRARIQDNVQKVAKADAQPDDTTEKGTKKQMLDTGNDGPLADPAGAEAPQNGLDDTKPY